MKKCLVERPKPFEKHLAHRECYEDGLFRHYAHNPMTRVRQHFTLDKEVYFHLKQNIPARGMSAFIDIVICKELAPHKLAQVKKQIPKKLLKKLERDVL